MNSITKLWDKVHQKVNQRDMLKRQGIKSILAYLIGIVPSNRLRCCLLRIFFGYRIYKSYIGWKTRIVVENAELTECQIGSNNEFIGPMSVTVSKGTKIGNSNTFSCGWWTQEKRFEADHYRRKLKIGENALITSKHHFDVAGSFVLGDGSWIAGCNSQFWTHGAGVNDRNITIGKDCYIGSAVRFGPGSSVGNNSIVGLGSVVTGMCKDENVIIAGHPAKIIRENYDWRAKKTIS